MSCGPRSRRATPVSILTGRKHNFRTSVALCFLNETRRFLLWICPPTSVLHIPNLSEIASRVPEICDFKNWFSFLVFFFLLFFFLLSHTYKNCNKTRTLYPIVLKFGTQKGGIKAHLGTNFGWNTINRQRVMSDYSRKITPICCHTYRLNRVWEEAENRWVNRLTIEPQTFCGFKLKTRKIQQKNQQCVTIMQSRLANKKTTACHAYQINRLG